MAKSNGFFGLRRGSTKNFTFSQLDGMQITKERVSEVKNPRTAGQMRQRMVMTTVGAAYKFLKAIADHSFEGKTSGMACMREFMSRNLNNLKAGAALNGSIPYNEYKDGEINPLPFVLALGSLEPIAYTFDAQKHLVIAFNKAGVDLTTAEGIYKLMGLQKGDLITFCSVLGSATVTNGVYDYKPSRFEIVRLYCDQSGAVDDVQNAFTISTNLEDAAVSFDKSNGLVIKSNVADFGCVIRSRKTESGWLRSNATMIVADGVVANASTTAQLATYPIGTDLILNNGPMANEENGSSNGAVVGVQLSFAQASINATYGSNAAAPALSGAPAGATITYTSKNPDIAQVNANTGVVTPMANGSAVIEAVSSVVPGYTSGKAQFTVIVSGAPQSPSLAFAQSSVSVTSGSTVAAPTLNGKPSGATLTYVSLNPDIASVDSNSGLVTPLANGTATIKATTSATDGYTSASATFQVVCSGFDNANDFEVDPAEVSGSLRVNQTATQKITFSNPENIEPTVKGAISYTVADDKQSVTVTYNQTTSLVTITLGSKSATVKFSIIADLD